MVNLRHPGSEDQTGIDIDNSLFHRQLLSQQQHLGMGFGNLFLQLIFLLTQLHFSTEWCLYQTYFEPNGNKIFEIDWSPDGSYIVTAAASGKLSVLSFATSNVVWSDTLSNDVYTAKFSKNGKWLGVGQMSTDNIRIYNVPSFTLNMSFSAGHGSSVTINELDFSYDNTKIVTCGSDGYVNQRTISPFSSSLDFRTQVDSSENMITCKYASTGRIGVAGTDDKIHVIRTSGSIAETQSKSSIKDVDFRPGTDQFLYGACTDNKLYEMDTTGGGSTLRTSYNSGDQLFAVSYAPDSSFAVTAGNYGNIFILTMTGSTATAPLQQKYVTGDDVNSVRVSDDSNFIAVGRVDGVIPIYARVCLSSCPLGFYFNMTSCRMCSADTIGCTSCLNSSVCFTCGQGYYLNTATNSCRLCDYALNGCLTCKSNTVCLTCNSGYYLASNSCLSCNSLVPFCEQCLDDGTCLKCSSYHYLNATSTCADCKASIVNCLSCALEVNISSPTGSTLYCRQCGQGYYASQSLCLACSANCDQCTSGNVCIACAQEFKLTGTTCTKCNQYCEACTEPGTCLECVPTTFLSGGACNVCSAPCLTCSVTASNCTTCMLGFWMSGTNTCTRCSGCSRCHPISGACLACPLGQYLSASGTCLNCLNTTSHCAICTLSSCQVCERNFYLSGTGCLLSASVTNCQIYQKNSTTVCEHCSQGFYLSTGTCSSCPTGCLICENSTFCTQCQIQYYLTASNTCSTCAGNCKTCTSSAQCLSCGDEYYLSGTSCLLCSGQISNCNSCLNSTHCVDCALGYQLASNSLSCTMCVSPCATCSSAGCLSCELGYFYSPNTCTRCPGTCSACTSLAVCQSCVAGYALDATNTACVSCGTLFPNCLVCNASACLGCQQYYQFSAGTCTNCSSTIANCLNCNNSGLCWLCVVGFYPAANMLSCVNCSSTMANCERCASGTACDKCLSGYYPSAANACSRCMEGCYTCNTAATCIFCSTGFVLVSGVCKQCGQYVSGCQMCTLASGCSNCLLGYYLASPTSCALCRTAMQGCSACTSNLVCVSCDLGYFINGTNKCQACSSVGCATCNPTTSVCTTCMVGYFINSSAQCQLCSSHYPDCGVCNSAACLRCDSGTYLSSGSCTRCSTLHQACILCNTTNCLQCESGYYLPAVGTCSACTLPGCEVCSPTGTNCLSCENLYYKSGSSCSLCESMNFGCLSCSGLNNCLLCKTGYYLHANGTCLLCSSLFTGCDICTSSRCLTCKTNYFHNASSVGGDCILCNDLIPGCSLCLNQGQCQLCESGYYLDAQQCSSCTSINQCLVCHDASTCLFCASGYYLKNAQCLSCSAAIPGCFSCASQALCQTCSGSFTISSGQCVEVKGVAPQTYTQIRIVSEYVNGTHLKHTLYSSAAKFVQIEQNWNQVTKIELVLPPNNKTALTILSTVWGSANASNSLIFYTNNPFGQVNGSNGANSMPMVKQFSRRMLLTLEELNVKVNFNMMKAAIRQILPSLDTSGQDLALEYKLDNPEFYKSVISNEKHYYYLFGVAVTGLLLLGYFIKICCVIPMTRDTGDIIPHVLLTKVPAMVIYPTLGGYINYCYGFTYADVPFFNSFFSNALTDQADKSPNSYRMFYQNLNIASTYLTSLIIFAGIYGLLSLYMLVMAYRNRKNKSKLSLPIKRGKATDTDNVSLFDQPYDRIEQFRSYIYNIFQAGLAFSSTISIVGMVLNPASVVTASGAFYILSVVVYTMMLLTAIKSFLMQKSNFNQIRVLIKATIMGLLFFSPVALFVVLVVVDAAILAYEYKLKIKEWVVPKVWVVSHVLCLTSYGVLIFLSNMSLGLIISAVCIVIMLVFDLYLQYAQHLEVEKIRDLQQKSKEYTENNLSIQDFIPEKQKQPDSRQNDFYFDELANNRNEPKKSNRVVDQTFSKSQGITASSFSLNFSPAKDRASKKEQSFTIRGLNQ